MNSNFFKKHKSLICCILAFFLPVILMFIISKAMGFYPFGRRSALVADMRYQFIDYAAYLKSVVFSDNDLLYTFSKTMAGFSFYYLADPFLLLLLFVPNKYLPAGILMLIILIMGLSSLNFEIMLNRIFGIRWASVIFATAYAFIGYFTAYFNFTIYFNNIMLLPLIILGLYMLITKERKNYLYIISLFFSVLTSYYMGYMTCMFTMIFTLYLFIMRGYFRDIKAHLKTLLIYIGSSALAVMMSFASLLISLLSLRDQKIGDAPLLSRLSLSI